MKGLRRPKFGPIVPGAAMGQTALAMKAKEATS